MMNKVIYVKSFLRRNKLNLVYVCNVKKKNCLIVFICVVNVVYFEGNKVELG